MIHKADLQNKRIPNSLKWFFNQKKYPQVLWQQIQNAIEHEKIILLIGETGCGKELLARQIYLYKKALQGLVSEEAPFVSINAANVPESLAESILFGHERGAFTSARQKQVGKFEQALKGSLFLDEIQCLNKDVQAKLLRVLEDWHFERLGGRTKIPVACNIICASNLPLELLVEKNTFRRDLYYRINLCPILLEPLRERIDELDFFVQHYIKKITPATLAEQKLNSDIFEKFKEYPWPGNLRELEHTLRFALIRTKYQANKISLKELPPALNGNLKSYLQKGDWQNAKSFN